MYLGKCLASALVAVFSIPAAAQAPGQLMTGDTRLACEAILCLASGTRPNECTPSLRRYFSITARRWSDTVRGRSNFLRLCPATNADDNVRSLVNEIANGSGRCDAASLNQTLGMWSNYEEGRTNISNQLPDYCAAYAGHSYTTVAAPRYLGTPERGGFWVDASDYDRALAEQNARAPAENAPGRSSGSYSRQ
jgi:hypothetical protein